ncbi:Ni/Fe hydrogenase subunit alpha [Vulcanococcus limneticus]|uniref:Ni/Fe hydrogenase subunit alpha n=1 Tax=Vulcanococcus limneticus TaxID=2170428 RepID=UPI000B986FD7|nr:Ni/Fe hydrogenase subunit alpha [Vulcanococcus limneticus]MCP9792153.1 Ni/Fe hydrogenase subunit alpha [Vulcanococcus limneticus MW73D5]MCP9893953.1 Ni/Fe hydrogenase subunit alpha [Vulcanococcus limneticus Candia 3F8]MCP9897545.1 Ni/Fe hydrogenase subunit alpha [Vulcanococcus limneticus Candia 3B3]
MAPPRRTITIDPVTRIEGHAKITIQLDAAGAVETARFHVTEYRGFEKFCEGRPFTEMAAITARICGICPVSHLLAAAKTGDKILAVTIPPTAEKLRRLMNLAQITQSHALSFFHLSSPDFLLGWDSDPARRNVFGLIAANPDLARAGIRLRQFGQGVIEALGGRKIHAAWSVPGGVREPLGEETRDRISAGLPEAFAITERALGLFKTLLDTQLGEELEVFGSFPSLFLGLVGPGGLWEHHRGAEAGCGIRIVDSDGQIVADGLREDDYASFLAEAVEPWSYLKFPYVRALGPEAGSYRVGPLARLNLCERIGTEQADRELLELRQRGGRVVTASFLYHLARLIEILACLEQMQQLLDDPTITATHVRARAGVNAHEAVGVSEAPRGTLFHHYRVDENGLIEAVNLIIATGQNNGAMNRTVTQIARHYLSGERLTEGLLNRVEAGIRCFDPCLSCSTHAAGQMPLLVELVGADGQLRDVLRRD